MLRSIASLVLFFAAIVNAQSCLQTTTSGSRNGANGIMFDLTAVGGQDITVHNFFAASFAPINGLINATVYATTNGASYMGNLAARNQWTAVAETKVGPLVPSQMFDLGLSINHFIPAGATQGFWIDLEDGQTIEYHNGNSEGESLGSDGLIEVSGGRGISANFAGMFSPRQFFGTVCYSVGGMQNAPTPAPAPVVCPYDGNLEVLYPPLLDENNTHVVLDGSDSNMKVTIIVPAQYAAAKFSFEGASDPSGGFDSMNTGANLYWSIDTATDPCNTIYTGFIPWDLFRLSLGGIYEDRYSSVVYYSTEIEVEVQRPITVTPETLLLLSAEEPVSDADFDLSLLQQNHTRTVRTRIPFEVAFDLELELSAYAQVTSDHLRVAAAVIDSSILTVDPSNSPLGTAQLELVTVIPLPLHLYYATVNASETDLSYYLAISEDASKRDCDFQQEFCTQHWIIDINPEQCTLNAIFTAVMHGQCHPDAGNCLQPSPDTTAIAMDITSDDFCGVSQQVDIAGSLDLAATECNDYMHGTVQVSSPDGAGINRTEIVQVRTSPTLLNPQFLTVFDDYYGTSILDYSATMTQPDQVDFSFLWEGSELRCDVVAHVEVIVLVEFQATRPLLLAVGQSGTRLLEDGETVHMSGSASISADTSDSMSPTEDSAAAKFSPTLVAGVISALSLLLAASL